VDTLILPGGGRHLLDAYDASRYSAWVRRSASTRRVIRAGVGGGDDAEEEEP